MESTLTLCVIDDIKAVVNGISGKIPWHEYGVSVCGTALDGEEGLHLIRERKPDIVITDIRMPKMDGIGMMKRIAEEGLGTKVIFISGYTDFSYAQEAVRLGAFDYVLKPFTPQHIVEAVQKAIAAIRQERSRSDKIILLERKVAESLPYLRQEYFKLLLRYEANPRRLDKQWDFLQMEMARSPLAVMVAEIDFFAERTQALPVGEVELIHFAIQNILEETLSVHTKGLVFRENIRQFVLVFNPPAAIGLSALAELCRENVETYGKMTVSIGLGMPVSDIRRINVAFEQAKAALSYNFYSGGNSVVVYREMDEGRQISPAYSVEKEKELLYALRSGNRNKCGQLVEQILMECSAYPSPPDPRMMTNLFYGLAFSIYRVLSEQLADAERRLLEAGLAEAKENRSLTLDGWRSYLKGLCRQGCDLLEQLQSRDVRKWIGQAKAYVQEHLLTDLTVHECAKSVHLSPSYFANIFKKHTGLTLMQYITQQRMERAKEMLAQGMQVQEISLMLGYEDRPYFSELFKKHCGMTPSEFRHAYLEGAEPGKK